MTEEPQQDLPPLNGPVLDVPTVRALAETLDGAFVIELIDAFREDSAKLVAELHTAMAEEDAVTLRRAAHTLKSHANTFGFTRLGPLCQAAESLGAAGNTAEAAPLVARIDVEYRDARQALEAVQTELRNDC